MSWSTFKVRNLYSSVLGMGGGALTKKTTTLSASSKWLILASSLNKTLTLTHFASQKFKPQTAQKLQLTTTYNNVLASMNG